MATDTNTGTAPPVTTAASDFAVDTEQRTLGSTWRNYIAQVRSGNLGSLPALLSIAVLCAVFGTARRDTFFSVRNFANLLQQAAPITVIAMAVTFVLLIGEIDLAAGFTAGVTGAITALKLNDGWPLPFALLVAFAVAAALGLFTGFLVARVGIPSFVVTLANFLSFQGILLLIAKEGGTIRITNKQILAFENSNMSVAMSWTVLLVALAIYAANEVRKQRASAGGVPVSVVLLRVGGLGAIGIAFVAILARNRAFPGATKKLIGVPYAVPLVLIIVVVLTFVLTRTPYGRHLYAVGGNAEAARRAGINVKAIRMSAFVLAALLAGVGGLFLGSQLASVSPQTGGNETLLLAVGAAVIGGTSLFGGKGRMINAVLGGIVLALIANGLPLIGKATPFGIKEINFSDSGVKFIVSGLVLLLAASVDALSRKRAA